MGRKGNWPSVAPRYDSSDSLARGSVAITKGGGRRRTSSRGLYADPIELMLAMLDVDSDLEWPRIGAPRLPAVEARALPPPARTRSVRTCLWNLVPVAASESMGMSSLTWTVWACCRRLSRREKRREQWHWNGRSPVCFLARISTPDRTLCGSRYSPDVPCKMLASGKAEVARGIVRAIESLRFLLLSRLRAISIHALLVRTGAIVASARLSIRIIHVHVVRIPRLPRVLRVFSLRRFLVGGGIGDLDGVGKWR